VCNGMCTPGYTDCNMNKQTDGCEANLQTDPVDRGTCGTVCSSNHMATVTCGGGICNGTCAAGWSDCNNNKQTDGCEANTATDQNNCGMCGRICTPDAGGNACSGGVCINNYTVGPSSQAFVDACSIVGHTNYLQNIDDGPTALIPMPIPFTFYGANVTQYWLHADGVMGFGTPFPTYFFACPLPNATDPLSSIMQLAVDLHQTANGLCVAVTGAAPNRQLVITESDAYIYPDATTHLTYTTFLNETTNTIDIVYQTMMGTNAQGQTAVVGIQSATLALAVQFSCHTASVPGGTAIRFTP
jgi:hypothetical protein